MLLVLVFSPMAGVRAQSPMLRMEPGKAEMQIGEVLDVGVTADGDAANGNAANGNAAIITQVEFKGPGPEWHISRDWEQPISGGVAPENWLWTARIQAFETGELRTPGVEATVRQPDGSTEVIELEGSIIRVIDGLDESDTALRDLEDIHPYRFDRRLIGALIAGGLLAALAMGIALRRALLARKNQPVPTEPPLPPGEWALKEIERRRRLPACVDGNSKAIATEASDVIRRFIQRRYGFPALEMTTHECVRRLRSTYVPAGLANAVRLFLEECDLAKFTRIELEAGRREAIWDDARSIVERSTEEERAPAAAGNDSRPGEARAS